MMEVTLREANLLKKIRQIVASGEFLLIVENGMVKRIKYSTVYHFKAEHKLMNIEDLQKIIQEKVPFGEVTVLTRHGWPYAISTTLNYDDLSEGF